MEHYATILNGSETLAADILANVARDRFIVYYVAHRPYTIVATYSSRNVDDAIAHANAWVTQTAI